MKKSIIASFLIMTVLGLLSMNSKALFFYNQKFNIQNAQIIASSESSAFPDQAGGYRATNAAECLLEKDCIWYAFSRSLSNIDLDTDKVFALNQLANTNHKEGQALFSKWAKDITIVSLANKTSVKSDLVQETLKQLQPFFPYGLSYEGKPDFLIIFSDSIDRDIATTYRERLMSWFVN